MSQSSTASRKPLIRRPKTRQITVITANTQVAAEIPVIKGPLSSVRSMPTGGGGSPKDMMIGYDARPYVFAVTTRKT